MEFPASGSPVAGPPRSPWAEARRDWPVFGLLLGGWALAGVPAGLLWAALAPRVRFRVSSTGPVPLGTPPEELLVAVDGTFVLLVAALGLIAGLATWALRRRRGVAAVAGLALGTLAGDVVAWQLGQHLAPRPSSAALAMVGAQLTTGLRLASLPALAVGPFVALLGYVLFALYTRREDLGRPPAPWPTAPSAGGVDPPAPDELRVN